MAKSGFWLRGAKGKLAGSTIYQTANGTVMREINTNPRDAKTVEMYTQQARFRSCAMLFKVFTKALENKAFENKKPGQSDYNIFIKENVNKTIPYPKSVADNYSLPAAYCPEGILSRGTLHEPKFTAPAEGEVAPAFIGLDLGVTASTVTTVGQLSTAIINNYGLADGDIITFAGAPLKSILIGGSLGFVPAFDRLADIEQFVLDSTSEAPVADFLSAHNFALVGNSLQFSLVAAVGTVFFSRNTADGLLVSTSPIIYTRDARDGVAGRWVEDPETYMRDVALSWGAVESNVILEGALVQQ